MVLLVVASSVLLFLSWPHLITTFLAHGSWWCLPGLSLQPVYTEIASNLWFLASILHALWLSSTPCCSSKFTLILPPHNQHLNSAPLSRVPSLLVWGKRISRWATQILLHLLLSSVLVEREILILLLLEMGCGNAVWIAELVKNFHSIKCFG